jgi:hypothetical protein
MKYLHFEKRDEDFNIVENKYVEYIFVCNDVMCDTCQIYSLILAKPKVLQLDHFSSYLLQDC